MPNPSPERPPREPGAVIDGWRIDTLLDDGATTLTYRVTQVETGAQGVLRLLKIADPTFAERLRRNAEALANGDDQLVPVLDVVRHGDTSGVVTAWVDGPDLGTWAQSNATLGHRLALFRDVIAGLEQAHRANLVHRNLKPVKVRVDTSRPGEPVRAYLEDFLLSRFEAPSDGAVTAIGVTFGTPQYMSPEQFHGAASVTPRGDLFSAGCVLYELVTGERAFDGTSIREVYMAIIDGEYTDPQQVAPELPDEVAALVRDLLQPATEDRPASATEVLARIDAEDFAPWVDRPYAELAPEPPKPKAPPSFPTLVAPETTDGHTSDGTDGASLGDAASTWVDDGLEGPRPDGRRSLWIALAATASAFALVGSLATFAAIVWVFLR